MISAHLPPGTKLVALNTVSTPGFAGQQLIPGREYILDGYRPSKAGHGKIYCFIQNERRTIRGIRCAYGLHLFNVVQLPPLPTVLLECLNARPVDKREVVEG